MGTVREDAACCERLHRVEGVRKRTFLVAVEPVSNFRPYEGMFLYVLDMGGGRAEKKGGRGALHISA